MKEGDATKLGKNGKEFSVSSRTLQFLNDNLHLFAQQTVIQVLHEFRFYSRRVAHSVVENVFVESTIVILARLDALVATKVSCIRQDGSDIVGGHFHKL